MIKEVLTSVRKTCMWALAPIGMLAAFSCQDDLVAERQPVASGDEIAFSVASDSTWAAMSRSEKKMNRHFITMIGKDSVFLQVVEEKNTDMPFATQDDESRSASFTTGNLNSFSLHAYYNNKEQFMMKQVVNKGEGDNWTYSPVKYWPNNPDDVISFYGYARYNNKGTFTAPDINMENKSGSFSYTLPAAETDAEKDDAVNQPDLIFAITPDQKKPTVTDKVELVFHHALSAILFKVGEMPDNVTITDISLKKVSTSGNCNYRLATEDDIDEPDKLEPGDIVFDWSNQNSGGTYTQTFNKTIDAENKMISGDDDWFMMIPQQLDDVILSVSFQIGQKDYNLEYALKNLPQAWEADTKYTYLIYTSGEVEVEVHDNVTPTVKSNVEIQNTGLATSYIRATVVGYWVNESDDIVAPWEFNNSQGTIIKDDNWGSYWEEGTDGFYYHKSPVTPGEFTHPLFDKYELTAQPPIVGAQLIVNVVVQARDTAW